MKLMKKEHSNDRDNKRLWEHSKYEDTEPFDPNEDKNRSFPSKSFISFFSESRKTQISPRGKQQNPW